MTNVVGKPPTPNQVRKEFGLPSTAKFKGWAVHTPADGRFLAKQAGSPDAVLRMFHHDPAEAQLFRTVTEAGTIVQQLTQAAMVVAVFDRGTQRMVAPVGGNGLAWSGTPREDWTR